MDTEITGVTVGEFLHRVHNLRQAWPRTMAAIERRLDAEAIKTREDYVATIGGWREMADRHFDWMLFSLRHSPASGLLPDDQVRLYLGVLVGLQASRYSRLPVSWN